VARRLAGNFRVRLTQKGPRSLEALNKELALTRRRTPAHRRNTRLRERLRRRCINKALLGADRGARHREAALDVAHSLTERIGGCASPAARQAA
jgi:hypothetical protein